MTRRPSLRLAILPLGIFAWALVLIIVGALHV
jgi:hypothetical protein